MNVGGRAAGVGRTHENGEWRQSPNIVADGETILVPNGVASR